MSRNAWIIVLVVFAAGIGSYFFINQPKPAQQVGAPLAIVKAPQLTAAEQAGEVAYGQYCVACHGKNGAGQDGVAPPLVHRIYEPNHHGDAAFKSAAFNGVRAHHWPFGDMPPVKGITEQDVTKIVTYVRALQRANGIN